MDCEKCNECSDESKGFYYFNDDLQRSVNAVEEVATDIHSNTKLIPLPTDVEKRGDILLQNQKGEIVGRVEQP